MDFSQSLKFILPLAFILVVFASCSNDASKKDNIDMESVIVDKNLQICEDAIFSFFNSLKIQKFEDCLGYFSDTLVISMGKDKIVEGLQSRNAQSGTSDSIQVYYRTKLSQDKFYAFYVRCFSKINAGGISYDKIVVNVVDGKAEFVSYEFSPMQYCDVNIANDTLSEIHAYLSKVYRTILDKGADDAFKLLDPEVSASIKKSDFENIYAEVKSKFVSKNTFVVKSVWSEIQRGIPCLNLIIESNCENSEVYIDELIISDRLGKYYLAKIEREKKAENIVQQLARPSESELKPFANEAASFYNLLVKNSIEDILQTIDKVVFQNNDYNAVKNSFSARNKYYGEPTVLNNTNVKAYSVDGNTVVDFSFAVDNSKGVKSYEKVSVIRKDKSKFLIYGYDFRDEPF